MDKTTETTIVPPIVTEEVKTAETQSDAEAKIAALEAEKATILEREANYKMAYLKEKKKNESPDPDESEEERIRRITREELAEREVSRIDTEKEALLLKLAKENKELKLAVSNRTTTPTSIGSHTETISPTTDSILPPEHLAAFKAKGWTDKDIERYKRNLQKNAR